ncbi:unnamed protein product, partial [Durusdinium trenchii]
FRGLVTSSCMCRRPRPSFGRQRVRRAGRRLHAERLAASSAEARGGACGRRLEPVWRCEMEGRHHLHS